MKVACEFCAGSGQVSYFKGVSRFLLSVEDCPECCGMGFVVTPDEKETKKKKSPKSAMPTKRKKT